MVVLVKFNTVVGIHSDRYLEPYRSYYKTFTVDKLTHTVPN